MSGPEWSSAAEAYELSSRARSPQQRAATVADEKKGWLGMGDDVDQDGGMSRSSSSTGSSGSSNQGSLPSSPEQNGRHCYNGDVEALDSDDIDLTALGTRAESDSHSRKQAGRASLAGNDRQCETDARYRRPKGITWTTRKAKLITLGATAATTALLSLYFGIFSTLFVFLAWVLIGLPLDLAFDYALRHEQKNVQLWASKKPTSGMLSTAFWLVSRFGRGVGLYAWLWAAGACVQHVVFPATPSIADGRSDGSRLVNIPYVHGVNTSAPIFVASNLYNSAHLFPRFSDNILELIDLLGGSSSTYVSIYESNSNDGNATYDALRNLERRLDARNVTNRIVTGVQRAQHIGIEGDANARIDMLATVRNLAMKPLDEGVREINGKQFRYVLWLNDIVFDPKEIIELLRTNEGVFDAACAFDFMPLGLYDTWVTRDTNGDRAKPLWPYFAAKNDVKTLQAGQPILVDSCWNGAVAFDARWFTEASPPGRKSVADGKPMGAASHDKAVDNLLPLRFRKSHRCMSSECLLTSLDMHRALHPFRPWIFMNPKVAVAYDLPTFRLHHDVMRWPLVRVWHFVWERLISSTLFSWLTDKGRKMPACRGVFQEDWAGPEVALLPSRWEKA